MASVKWGCFSTASFGVRTVLAARYDHAAIHRIGVARFSTGISTEPFPFSISLSFVAMGSVTS